jgi:hypothetical protein
MYPTIYREEVQKRLPRKCEKRTTDSAENNIVWDVEINYQRDW